MTKRDVKLKLANRIGQKQDKSTRYRAVLCASDGSRTTGSVWANEDYKLVYFQFFGSGGIGVARCQKIEPELGLGVYVGKTDDNLEWQVLEDDAFLRRTATDPRGYQSVAARDFEPGGRLQLWLYTKLIVPLATYDTPGTLEVNVVAGDYPYLSTRKTFAGQVGYDLTSHVPGGGLTRYVGLYLDSSNTLQAINGATIAIGSTPAEPTWPAGAFRLSVVQLDNGQTSISFADDIFDRRMPWSDVDSFKDWPFTHVLTVSTTDPAAGYSTIAAAITAASAGDGIWLDDETFSLAATLTINKAITLFSDGEAAITSSVSPTVSCTVAGVELRGLNLAGTDLAPTIVNAFDTVIDRCRLTGLVGTRAVYDNAGSTYTLLRDCHLGGKVQAGIGTIIVENGRITGQVDGANVYMLDPILENLTLLNNPKGHYFDTSGNRYTAPNTKLTLGNGATTPALNITERSAAPATPATQDIYLDDGTNFLGGGPGLRRYTGTAWEDVGGWHTEWDDVVIVKNTSGAAAAVGDVGYISYVASAGGEYKTTTTASDDKFPSACAVVVGGANNANIYVKNTGRVTVKYAGSAPSAGDFLLFSTTAGSLTLSATMHPNLVAVAQAAGSGGLVDALLMCHRTEVRTVSSFDVFRVDLSSGSNFTGTINGAPSGATVVYTITGGTNEDSIKPADAGELAKMVLHNTTRGDSALIDSVDLGTNTITLTANAPAGWQSGDVITTRSQTNTDTLNSMYFYDYDLSSADNAIIPVLATYIEVHLAVIDAGSAQVTLHPLETGATSKRTNGINGNRLVLPVALINRKFCVQHNASGSATLTFVARAVKMFVASP